MIIQHNLAAMNANRNLGINNKKQKEFISKLSSGYRINSASDDAAGLAISEKMRGQIRGLNQASQNAEDGISLVQTAEGAMQKSQDILHRMRVLSVQAANDTYTEEDRECISKELDQLSQELDRIATTTEFNTKKILDGTYGDGVSDDKMDVKTKIQQYLKGSWLQDSLTRIEDALGLKVDKDATLSVVFNSLGSSVVAQMWSSNGGNNFKLEFNTDFLDTLKVEDLQTESGPLAGGILFDRLITHEMTHAVTIHNYGNSFNAPKWFTEGIAEAVQGMNRTFPETETQLLNLIDGHGSNPDYEQGYYAVSYMAYNTVNGTFQEFLDDMDSGKTFDQLVNQYYGVADGAALMQKVQDLAHANAASFLNSCHITYNDGKEDALLDWDQTSENIVINSGVPEAIIAAKEKLTLSGHTWTVTWEDPKLVSAENALRLQIGANSGQELAFYIGDMRAKSLIGASKIDVSTHDLASSSITRFDNAIKKVSGYRARLGAYQNRLEHTIANLDNSSENLQASESQIRDTDMAETMVELSKENILTQAGTSMLSNANSSRDLVLQLLQQ